MREDIEKIQCNLRLPMHSEQYFSKVIKKCSATSGCPCTRNSIFRRLLRNAVQPPVAHALGTVFFEGY
jgi:hypothetical protein